MQFVTRLADPDTAAAYPLSCAGPTSWTPCEDGKRWRMTLQLPKLPPRHIVVPSFTTLLEPSYQFQFKLTQAGHEIPLQPVPAERDAEHQPTAPSSAAGAITPHIDCWHSVRTTTDITLELLVHAPTVPERYLIALNIRPLDHESGEYDLPTTRVRLRQPRRISQMRAPKEIRQRICSPTALAMALTDSDPPVDWADTVAACFDPITRAYGSWPLALHWASRHGRLGAVETFYDWPDVTAVLARGTPMVCSIRFAADELQTAPLKQTSGHLVTLYGVDKNIAYVFDPAGKNIQQVARKYDIEEFSKAWLARRGAAYVFCSRP